MGFLREPSWLQEPGINLLKRAKVQKKTAGKVHSQFLFCTVFPAFFTFFYKIGSWFLENGRCYGLLSIFMNIFSLNRRIQNDQWFSFFVRVRDPPFGPPTVPSLTFPFLSIHLRHSSKKEKGCWSWMIVDFLYNFEFTKIILSISFVTNMSLAYSTLKVFS